MGESKPPNADLIMDVPGFGMVPNRLAALLSSDDLTFKEFGLLAFLLVTANFRTHTWIGTLWVPETRFAVVGPNG